MKFIGLFSFVIFLFFHGNAFSGHYLKTPKSEDIAGGEASCKDNSHKCKPWVVSIITLNDKNEKDESKGGLCSGSLISPRYVLTAKHCNTKKYIIKDYKKMRIGTAKEEDFFIYDEKQDIALLKLSKPVELKEYGHVRRKFSHDLSDEELFGNDYYYAEVYGYGVRGVDNNGKRIRNNGTQYRADVKIVDTGFDFYGGPSLFVISNKEKGFASGIGQPGDSGGPVIWKDTIIGVVSTANPVNPENYNAGLVRASDITENLSANYPDKNKSSKNLLPYSAWFSQTMKKVWIDNPDWKGRLAKRSEKVIISGWGKPDSKIEISFSLIENKNKKKLAECFTKTNGNWECSVPLQNLKDLIPDGFNEKLEYPVFITAEHVDVSPREKWEGDTIESVIPPISKEFSIIYPIDDVMVTGVNFDLRGYADPNSEIEFVLMNDSKDKVYKQDQICKKNNINSNGLIPTSENGFWSCWLDLDRIIDTEINYTMLARQIGENRIVNIFDKINFNLNNKKHKELLAIGKAKDKYKKVINFDIESSPDAKKTCIYNRASYSCGKDTIPLLNVSYDPKLDISNDSIQTFKVGGKQYIDGVDPLSSVLRFNGSYSGIYYPPEINNKFTKEAPLIFSSSKEKEFKGIGGDRNSYTLNGITLLPSMYEINKYDSESGKFNQIMKSDLNVMTHANNSDIPYWVIKLPDNETKEGVYSFSVRDDYSYSGSENQLDSVGNNDSDDEKSYFEITSPDRIETKSPADQTIQIEGAPIFLSGTSNAPGSEARVSIKKSDQNQLSALKENRQHFAKRTIICTNAIISDNGNWQCEKPSILPAGTYELTSELIKEGKIVATDVTHFTIKDRDNDEPEKKKFEINNPPNNSTVDPDNPIKFSGTFSGPAGGGGGGGGFGGFLSGLFGAIFGALEGIASLFTGMFGFFWEFVIHPGDIFGGDVYTMELQETQHGVNVGVPIKWTFTIPMRITEPTMNAQYRLNDGISIEGQGSPGQLVFVAASEHFLPPKKMELLISRDGIICETTINEKGKWACPTNPVLVAKNEGTFFLYAAQYKKTKSAQLGQLADTYERTSQVTRKYEVTKTKISITEPIHGAKITKLPFMISGLGEQGSQVYIKGFGGTDDCNTSVDTSSGKWSCGPYQPKDGKYTISAEQVIDSQQNSSAQVSFEVQTKTIKPVVITLPQNGDIYHYLDAVVPRGTGEPGTTVCLDKKALSQVCKNRETVSEQGYWEADGILDTSVIGENKLVVTAFLDNIRQSTAKITYKVIPDAGEIKLSVITPKEDEIIKTPSYTFSGTMPSDAKNVTVKAFGGHDDCSAKLNMEEQTWTCGPYSSVPGDYDVVVVDDAGTQVNRSFKVRYGANLQISVLSPAEGEQITTPTYTISGKGQAGARVTVSMEGKQICEVDVNENQDWACPDKVTSITGSHQILVQQWVDDVPSGKPIARNYEVIYGMSDITIDSSYLLSAICPDSIGNDQSSVKEAYVDVSGSATKGFYISVSEPMNNKVHCKSTQASEIDGSWSCRVYGVTPGVVNLAVGQSLTSNGEAIGPTVSQNFEVEYKTLGTPQIISPTDGYSQDTLSWKVGFLSIGGLADPDSQVLVTIHNNRTGNDNLHTVYATKNGHWNTDILKFRTGGYSVQASSSNCGVVSSSDIVNFKLTQSIDNEPHCPYGAICHD
ncbi:trypsin-like serine protease [Xenorhabdus sp. 42]|uniref:trypsin-like serine protease n=1 Tax=Xenorhabdus szentirmaii TaxID=290112 RepID=UPI0019B1CC8A|nr:trypsin-like serine protease [Xenorhabdus sp. 42]MBD2821269.1 trypsin-like serine protease [Xenorhabdus sp. 42]